MTIGPECDLGLEFFQSTTHTTEELAGFINIPAFTCEDDGRSGNTFFGNAFFPERLRKYVTSEKN